MSKVELVPLKSSSLTYLLIPQRKGRFQQLIHLPEDLYKFALRVYLSIKTKHLLLTEKNIVTAVLDRWNTRLIKAGTLSHEKLANFLCKTSHLEEAVPHLIPASKDYKHLKSSLELCTSDFYAKATRNNNLGLQQLIFLTHENPTFILALAVQISKIGSAEDLKAFLDSSLFLSAPDENKVETIQYFIENVNDMSQENVKIIAATISSDELYDSLEMDQIMDSPSKHLFFQFFKRTDPAIYEAILAQLKGGERTPELARSFQTMIEFLETCPEEREQTIYKTVRKAYVELNVGNCESKKENWFCTTYEYFKIFKIQYSDFLNRVYYRDIIFFSLIKYLHQVGLHIERDNLIREFANEINTLFSDYPAETLEKKSNRLLQKLKEQKFGFTLRYQILKSLNNKILELHLIEYPEEQIRKEEFLESFYTKNVQNAAKNFCLLIDSCELSYMTFEGKNFWDFLATFKDKDFLKEFQEKIYYTVNIFAKNFGWYELAFADLRFFNSPHIEHGSKMSLWKYHFDKLLLGCDDCTTLLQGQEIFSQRDIHNVLMTDDLSLLDTMLPLSNVYIGLLLMNLEDEEKALYLLKKYPNFITQAIEFKVGKEEKQTYLFFIALKNEWYGVLKHMIDISPECLSIKSSKGTPFLHFATPQAIPLITYIQKNYPQQFEDVISPPKTEEEAIQLLQLTFDGLKAELNDETKLALEQRQKWFAWLKLKLDILEQTPEIKLNITSSELSKLFDLIKTRNNGFDTLASNSKMELKSLHQAWLLLCPDFKIYLRQVVEEIVIKLDDDKKFYSCINVWKSLNEFSHLIPLKEWIQFWQTPYSDGKTLIDLLKPLNEKSHPSEGNPLTKMRHHFFVADSIALFLFPYNRNAINDLYEETDLQEKVCELYWLVHFQPSKSLKIYNLLNTIIKKCSEVEYNGLLKFLDQHLSGLKPLMDNLEKKRALSID